MSATEGNLLISPVYNFRAGIFENLNPTPLLENRFLIFEANSSY